MSAPLPNTYIKAIHAAARTAGLDEDARRDVIARASKDRTRSSKGLTVGEAVVVIEHLKGVAGGAVARPKPKPAARGALNLEGQFVPVIRAFWISGFHLGVIHDRTDEALASFVKRQTGIEHVNWVRDPVDARKVIQALKSWLQRAAGVEWPKGQDPLERKLAVYLALRRLLTAAGVDPDFLAYPGRVGVVGMAGQRLDELTKTGGAALRRARKAR